MYIVLAAILKIQENANIGFQIHKTVSFPKRYSFHFLKKIYNEKKQKKQPLFWKSKMAAKRSLKTCQHWLSDPQDCKLSKNV